MSACAISLPDPIRPADDPFVIGLVTVDARTGALDADLGFRRFCHGLDASYQLDSVPDLLSVVVPEDRAAVRGLLLAEAPLSRHHAFVCRIHSALGGVATVRFLRSRRADGESSDAPATFIVVAVPEPASAASPLERVALLLIEAEGLARGLGNGLLSKLIRAVLLQVGFDAGAGARAEHEAANDAAKH